MVPQTQLITDAIANLRNPNGSTAREIHKYLVSNGYDVKDTKLRPALLAALKSKKLMQSGGCRSRFLLWKDLMGDSSVKSGSRSRDPKRDSKRHRRRSQTRKRKRRSVQRRRKHPRSKSGRKRRTRRKGKTSSQPAPPPAGKQLVMFYARKNRSRRRKN